MKKAFTLLELLVVVAIIGILAGLSLAALIGAKEQGKSAYCKNNLRQVSHALIMYSADYEVYPYSADFTDYTVWWQNLESYMITEAGSMGCPSYRGLTGTYWRGGTLYLKGIGYGINGFGSRSDGRLLYSNLDMLGIAPVRGARDIYPLRIPVSRVTKPSEMLSIGDSFRMQWRIPVWHFLLLIQDGAREGSQRHGPKSNFSFVDGHIDVYRPSVLVSPEYRRVWNLDNLPHFNEKL